MKSIQVLDIHQFKKQEKENFFYSNTLYNHLKEYHKDINIPHKHNFYLSVLFTNGEGLHEIDFEKYTVQKGSLFFMNPGQTHHWILSDNTEGYIFFHSKQFYELHFLHKSLSNYPFFFSTKNIPFLQLEGNDFENIEEKFKAIQSEYSTEKTFKNDKIISLIDLMYIESSRIYEQLNFTKISKNNLYSDKIIQLENLIEKNFLSLKNAGEYASLMNISTKHLNRITQNTFGKTTSQLISDRIILEAKRMFFHSKNSFSNIALELGYEDYAYFSRLFKNKNGESPSDFMKKYK